MLSLKGATHLQDVFARHRLRLKEQNVAFDVVLTKNKDGTEQVDNKAIAHNFDLIQDISLCTRFKIPTTLQIAKVLARVDSEAQYDLSRCQSKRSHMVWVQYESEKIHHVLSVVNRRCARSRTSKITN